MKVIDSDNYAEHGIETLFFPGGEPHAKIPPGLAGSVLLFLKLRTWNDVGIAACVADALARSPPIDRIEVFMPYFPGARQDRHTNCAPLTVALSAALFDSIKSLHVFDAHSEAVKHWTGANCWMPADIEMPALQGFAGIIAPDAGAVDRATAFRDRFGTEAEVIRCSKHRDPRTGRLSGYLMPPLERVGRYMIVDDICDGGGTFNLLATAFNQDAVGARSELMMFVSHGIFSKGLEAISPKISYIMTTDSWCRLPNSERLHVLPLKDLFPKILGET